MLVGLAVVLLFTVPGLAFDARKMVRTATGSHVQYVLTADDARALAWVDAHQPGGGILAPTPFASVVPSRTGLPVYVGHGYWSRDYVSRAREVDRLFDGRLRRARPGPWSPARGRRCSSRTAHIPGRSRARDDVAARSALAALRSTCCGAEGGGTGGDHGGVSV